LSRCLITSRLTLIMRSSVRGTGRVSPDRSSMGMAG
jgi:hypothetical protein